MLIIENQQHFDEVREFARSVGAAAELQKRLDFLANFGGDAAKVRCRFYSDFAPHSFFWRTEYSSLEGWKTGLVGGLIYSGPDAPSDGSAPSFSVSLNPDAAAGRTHMWSTTPEPTRLVASSACSFHLPSFRFLAARRLRA